MKKQLTPLLLVLCLLSKTAWLSAQKNIIENGNFDTDLYGWTVYGAIQTPWVYKQGKGAAVIVTYTGEKWAGMDQVIKVDKKATAISFSCWVKLDAVVTGDADWKKAIVNIEFLDATDKKIGETISVVSQDGTMDWQLAEKKISIPSGSKKAKISIAMGYSSGSLFVDEVKAVWVQ
jgi:hypothetical protein